MTSFERLASIIPGSLKFDDNHGEYGDDRVLVTSAGGGGDQDEKVGDSHRSGNAAANTESVSSTMFTTMHGDKKREEERYTVRAPNICKWKDSHEAKCVLSLKEWGNGSCGGTLHRILGTQMDPGQRTAFGTFSEHGQNDWRLDTAGDEAYLDDFVLCVYVCVCVCYSGYSATMYRI
jgi:hypothetical protein